MPPAKATTAPARKRNRKRKRRAASSASSSSSSSSSEGETAHVTIPAPTAVARIVVQDGSDSDSDSDSDSSSSASSSAASGSAKPMSGIQPGMIASPSAYTSTKPKRRRDSRSPSPPPTDIPSFLPAPGTEGAQQKEEELKARFRKFWMTSIADGFRNDLEELHKEPNLTESRLSLLIDSLASGADVFMAGPSGNANRGLESVSGANEMEIALDGALQ
ncbi:hypothetical protein BDV93DRAFT_552332 [Ceratobasidium sp. AG-I]|nr:hypothetical protein BDV93DRAFT_552332 [Ceratobasidium sp. AG-I]